MCGLEQAFCFFVVGFFSLLSARFVSGYISFHTIHGKLAKLASRTHSPGLNDRLDRDRLPSMAQPERQLAGQPGSTRTITAYSDEFKASAVAALTAAGYPHTFGSLAEVSRQFKVSATSLITWAALAGAKAERDPNAVTELLVSMIVSELVSTFVALETKRDRASYSQLSIGMGILFDKLFMLTGNVPEIKVDLVHRIAEAITAPWTTSNAGLTDSAGIVDSSTVSDDSDGQDADDAETEDY